MTDLPEPHTGVDHYEAALEAGSSTLITLQSILASATGGSAVIGDVEGQITRAINELRRAMAELRLAHPERQSTLLIEFVLVTDGGDFGGVGSVRPLPLRPSS